jgi:hypothetical protein
MTDKEIDLLVQALIDPPPYGFTKSERKEFIEHLKKPSAFIECAERRMIPSSENKS